MNKFSKELIESLTEACEHAEGKPSGVRVHVAGVPDVRAIRRQLADVPTGIRPRLSHPAGDAEELGTGPPPARCPGSRISAGHRQMRP